MSADVLETIGKTQVDDFAKDWRKAPDDKCWWFNSRAQQLETELLATYRTTVILTKEMEDLGEIAKSWEAMVSTCKKAVAELQQLIEVHPDCNAEVYRDGILDLGARCLRLKELHS